MVNNETDICLVIDVMLLLRRVNWKDIVMFSDVAKSFCTYMLRKASHLKTKRIDFVFDSYFQQSLKSTEHQRRSKKESIDYHSIDYTTKLPKQAEKFWGSSINKIKLQKFLREYILDQRLFDGYDIVFSTINDDCNTSNRLDLIEPELQRYDKKKRM